MDATTLRGRLRLLLFAASFLAYGIDAASEQLPTTQETLQAVGRRLSRSWSERDLTAIASRADLALRVLNAREKAALARGYLRFKVALPAVVDVAVPAGSIPFWIGRRGFRRTDIALENADTQWILFRRPFKPGWIGLGVNGLDRTPVAHYAVFVRPSNPRDRAIGQGWVTLDQRQAARWQISLACPGASAARDSRRPFGIMPPELVGAVLLRASHSQRHSALLAAGRVWKTRVASSPRPDQVAVAFGSDAARELVWTWRTSPEIKATALRIARALPAGHQQLAAGTAGASGGDVRIVTGESTSVAVPDLLNDPIVRRHRVWVDHLEPDTLYRYSLGDGTREGWGQWQTVKTGPDRSHTTRFLYLGDAQTGLASWGRLLNAALARHPAVHFIIIAGDLVDRGNERTNWDHFFLRARGVFDRCPLMPCSGNHEYLDRGPRLYRAVFELPRNGPRGIGSDLVYHFDCGDAFFAVMDSTLATCDPDAARRQADWLDVTLQKSRATWKFVVFHHPVYPSHPWRDTPALREHWVPILDKHHVDFVLQGHDHAYQRTYPLRDHHRVAGPGEGTIYLIAVSGDKFVECATRPYAEVRRSGVSTYQTFDIDPQSNRLTFRAWTQDGTIIDELCIDKPRPDQKAEFSTRHQKGAAHVISRSREATRALASPSPRLPCGSMPIPTRGPMPG
jgi:hypothetical protein